MNPVKFGSVCSGIEAASVAWGPLGWKAAWFSEIEPFPSAVLAHRFPDVPNLGDMTALPGRVRSGEVEAPEVFCGGTPCQAFSVAGLRRSLDDARGNLSLVFCEIANAIDFVRSARGDQPCIVFWENVPGVLSTKDNAFGCFLAGLAGEDDPLVAPGGKWSNAGVVLGPARAVAWRVFDAQYFGVAQRRRRVFVVASAREGFDPAAILFEFEGVRRDTAPRREAGEGASAGTLRSTDGGSDVDHGQAGHLQPVTCMAHGQGGAEIREDSAQTLTCNHEAPIAAYAAQCVTGDITHTLKAEGFDASEDGTGRGTPLWPVLPFDTTQVTSATNRCRPKPGDPCHPLAAGAHAPATAFNARQDPDSWSERTGPLDTDGCTQAVQVATQVRRLTPRECERLQGFPDDWTLIPWKAHQAWAKKKGSHADGKSFEEWLIETTGRGLRQPATQDCPDGPRYKAIGNSWAVPNVRWIGRRIDAVLRGDA